MIFIIRSLQTKEEYKRLTKVVEQVFPEAGNFKLPPGDDAVRITFAEGVKMLKEAGVVAEEMADLRYGSSFFTVFRAQDVPLPFFSCHASSALSPLSGSHPLLLHPSTQSLFPLPPIPILVAPHPQQLHPQHPRASH